MMGDTYAQISEEAIGLSNAEHLRRLDTVGRNAIEVEMPSILQSLVEEFFCFFYIYQIVCYYSWYFTGYWNVAFLNTIVIIGAATINIINKRSMMCNIVQMTHYECEVTVKRDGSWKTVKSSDIVPGDLVRVDENWLIPCDMIIVKGSTVCDESMLTGESMPVQKFPIPSDSSDAYVVESSGKKYTLFAGTKALSSGRNEEILAVVQSTGAHTSRGQLIQSILFPVPMRFKYDEHLKVVVVFLFLWGIVAAYLAMYFLIGNAGLGNKMFAFVYGMFMFSAVLSPLLPVVITVGQVNAAKRLQKLGVFCLNSQRITLCGKLRVFCFDKTGTITKEGLDFRGCVPIDKNAFVSEVNNVTSKELNSHMKFALASCHAVGSLNGELVGNQVEVKMFKATQWKLIEEEGQLPVVESPEGNDALEVVKRFEFDHHRMSMSVVMRHKTSGKMYVFVKGSYEKMQQLSRTETIPSDYVSHAETLAKNGCYVLGMGMKEITTDLQQSEKELENFLSNRDAVEQNVNLLGLIMFRNELKNDSRESILKLKEGDIRVVMITGDNAMTGCFIARESGMVNANAKVILGDMIANESNEGGAKNLVWKNVDTEETFSLDQIYSMLLKNNNSQDDIELAVTGAAFDYLLKIGELKKLLLNIRIFSRMTPSGKVECVKLHMTAGAVTGMCGDGGNDCGALRIAHVGVALSDAEASVVSPFTSKTKSIASVIDLCREGRCSLATSFGSVKFLIMYGLIGCGLRFTMYSNSVFVAEYGFMFCDGAILVGLSYAITLARPLKKLGKQRPTSSLVGPTTILSMIGQEIIHALFLYFGIRYVMTRSWYCPFNPANVDLVKWWLLQDSNLGTSLWYLVAPQQMIGAITYSLGSKFRLPVWRNYFLMFYFALLFVFMNVIFLGEPNVVSDRFRIASSTNVIGLPDIPLPDSFRWDLFWIVIANMATIVLFEWFVILGPVRHYFRNKYHKDSLTLKL
jgi:cation-transporting ATPase 13A3/4/5